MCAEWRCPAIAPGVPAVPRNDMRAIGKELNLDTLLDRLDGSVLCIGPDRNEAVIPDGIDPSVVQARVDTARGIAWLSSLLDRPLRPSLNYTGDEC